MKSLLLAALSFLFVIDAFSQNNPPVAVDDTVEVISQVPTLIDALANDYDPDGDSIFISDWTEFYFEDLDTADGQLLIYSNRFKGKAVLNYIITDNGNPPASSEAAKVFTFIIPNPDAPVSNADTFDLLHQVQVNLDVLANDWDPQGNPLKIIDIFSDEHCEASLSEDSLTVTVRTYLTDSPVASFYYLACETETEEKLLADLQLVQINLMPNPDIPVAMPDSASTTGGVPVVIPILQNDIDIQGEDLEMYKLQATSTGELVIDGDSIIYTPDLSFAGNVRISYMVREVLDTSIHSAWSYVKFQVLKNQDCPVGVADFAEGMIIEPFIIDVLENDYDPMGNELEIWDIDADATVEIINNKINYKSKPEVNGFDTLYYRIKVADHPDFYSEWTPIYISLQENPDMPEIIDDHYSGSGNFPIILSPLDNDLRNTADSIIISHIQPTGTCSLTKISDSSFYYQAFSNAPEFDTIKYDIWDKNNHDLWATGFIFIKNEDLHYYDSLLVNNINAGVNADGMLFANISQTPGHGLTGGFFPHFKYPAGLETCTIFNSTLWIGGFSSEDSLHFCGERYRQIGVDFQAGPVSISYDSTYKMKYWKLWKLNKTDIDYHRNNWWKPGYQPIEDILLWPGNGDILSGQSEQLAPYQDIDQDGIFNPMSGDYPLIRGDQCIFIMYNDDLNHTESAGKKMKIEVHAMIYGFDMPGDSVLSNTVFVHYDLYNRSELTYSDVYTGIFTELELGNFFDDYIGSDVSRSSYYCFNGDDFDEGTSFPWRITAGYGMYPPAQSVTLLAGPFLNPDGQDNPIGSCDYSINGFNFDNEKVDDERFGLCGFMSFSNEFIYESGPILAEQMYGLMNGYMTDGTGCYFGGNGHFTNKLAFGPVCHYMFPGDSDPQNWGTNCVSPGGPYNQEGFFWADSNMNMPFDRRGEGSMGPFTFAPGDVQEIDLAYVVANGWDGPVSSVNKLMEYIDTLRYKVSQGEIVIPNDQLGLNELNGNYGKMKIFPNPASSHLNIELDSYENNDYEYKIYDVSGRIVVQGEFISLSNALDISYLKNGFYILMIKSEDSVYSGKFIKN